MIASRAAGSRSAASGVARCRKMAGSARSTWSGPRWSCCRGGAPATAPAASCRSGWPREPPAPGVPSTARKAGKSTPESVSITSDCSSGCNPFCGRLSASVSNALARRRSQAVMAGGHSTPRPVPPARRSVVRQRLEELGQVGDLAVRELEREGAVVVLDDVRQRGEAAVVVEAALLVGPQAGQGRGAVAMVGIARGLEVVDADLRGGMRVPAGLRVERRDVAARALRLAREELA